MGAHVDPPKWTFPTDYISAVRDAAASNFYTRYNPLMQLYIQLDLLHRAASSWTLPHISSVFSILLLFIMFLSLALSLQHTTTNYIYQKQETN